MRFIRTRYRQNWYMWCHFGYIVSLENQGVFQLLKEVTLRLSCHSSSASICGSFAHHWSVFLACPRLRRGPIRLLLDLLQRLYCDVSEGNDCVVSDNQGTTLLDILRPFHCLYIPLFGFGFIRSPHFDAVFCR